MRILPRKFLLIAAALLLSTPLTAQQLNLKHSICFGDSLTHNDILGLVNFLPQDMYGMDPFEAMWEKGKPANATLNRYAIAGSRSQHLWAQITAYELAELFGLAPSGTCFQVEIGGNDFFSNDFVLGANPPGTNAKADAVVDDLLDRIHNTVTYLGLRRPSTEIILWTVPDITLTPSRWHFTPQQKANIRAHLQRANRKIMSYNNHPRVAVLDFYKLHHYVVQNLPTLNGTTLVGPPAHGKYHYLHADDVHPTAVGNGYIANALADALNKKFGSNIPMYSDAELAALAHL